MSNCTCKPLVPTIIELCTRDRNNYGIESD